MFFSYLVPLNEFQKLVNCQTDCQDLDPNRVYIFPPKTLLLNGFKLFSIFTYIIFIYQYKNRLNSHSIFKMIAYQCGVAAVLKVASMLTLIFAWVFPGYGILAQISLFCDMTIGYFSIVMLYPLTANQLLSRMHRSYWRRIFNTPRTAALVIATVALSMATVTFVIFTSQLSRSYVKKTFVDSGVPNFQMIVTRIFYIFPIGSLICYSVLFLHMKLRSKEHAVLCRFEGRRSRKVFAELLITVVVYATTCLLFEILMHINHFSDIAPLGFIIIMINFIPEICLPCLLIFPNKEFQKQFSQLLPSRSTTQNSAAVAII